MPKLPSPKLVAASLPTFLRGRDRHYDNSPDFHHLIGLALLLPAPPPPSVACNLRIGTRARDLEAPRKVPSQLPPRRSQTALRCPALPCPDLACILPSSTPSTCPYCALPENQELELPPVSRAADDATIASISSREMHLSLAVQNPHSRV
ncbi:hypothetical protein TgHK011_007413 [Trichoderma gracile]|nr:hypothetical protein TgHK011_007413 [Trichoderma gracile]